MSTQQVNGSAVTASSTINDGGSVLNGGSTVVLNNVSLGYSDVGVFGSSVIDGTDTDKSIDAGTFSYENQRPIAKRITTELAGGVSNTTLQSGASQPGLIRSIHKLEVLRTTKTASGIRANKFNPYTNSWDAGYPQVSSDTLASDTAATPTRSAPGQLTYKLGNPVPVTDNDYDAKTG